MKRQRIFTIGIATTILVAFTIAPVAATSHAEPSLGWVKGIGGGIGYDSGLDVAVDGSGNVYVVGYFNGDDVDFNPGGTPHERSSNGDSDVFLAKYNAAGNLLWGHPIGGTGTDLGYGIAVDGSGNVYVTGSFEGNVDFDPDPGDSHPLSSNGNADIFVAKYDTNGDFLWAHGIGGTGFERGYAIAVDGSGNAYVTGFLLSAIVDFDPDGTHELNSNGDSDAFVAKYDTSGGFLWAHNIGGSAADAGYGITVDGSGNAYVTGKFSGSSVDFNPGGTDELLDSNGGSDAFLAKYNTTGMLVWAHNMGGAEHDEGWDVELDGSGNIHLTGQFWGENADFNPAGDPHFLDSNGLDDAYVAKYDTTGSLLWAHNLGGTASDYGYAIAVDGSGNTYLTGYFQSESADFNPGGEPHLLDSDGSAEIFVASYDSTGDLVWAYSIGEGGFDWGFGIAVDGSGNAVVTGSFDNTDVNFDPNGSELLDSNGFEDMFILKLEPPLDPGVFRLSGANRFETAAAVAAHHHPDGADTVFVATGTNFPDALAGAVAAASAGSPLLLVSSIPPATATALGDLDPTDIIVLGGEAAVDAATATDLGAYGAVTRLSGSNRYDTAVAISQWAYPTDGTADAVVIATGTNFPDALAAASLATQVNGPVLLSPTGNLPQNVSDEIERLDPATIYIIGGTAAISTAVADQLATLATTTRLSGTNRYNTAIAISQEAFPAGAEIVYVAVGTNFPDALAGAPQAAAAGAPVLLTPTDSLPAAVATEITRLGPVQIIVLGGTSVISPNVANQLEALLP